MGLAERHYYRRPTGPAWNSFKDWSITNWLVIINVAIFVLDRIMGRFTGDSDAGPLTIWGYFSLDKAVFHFQAWRFVTFQFLHADPSHIFWNMFGLFFFGPVVERHLGGRRFLAFYLLCGVGGPLGYILLSYSHILRMNEYVPLIGASAGIYGILVAGARIAPNLPFVLAFTPFQLTLKTWTLIYLAIAAFTVLAYGGSDAHNAGGEAAHLGGAVIGLLLIFNEGWLDLVYFHRPRMRIGGRKVTFHDWRRDSDH